MINTSSDVVERRCFQYNTRNFETGVFTMNTYLFRNTLKVALSISTDGLKLVYLLETIVTLGEGGISFLPLFIIDIYPTNLVYIKPGMYLFFCNPV
jgi:hypothetical protein